MAWSHCNKVDGNSIFAAVVIKGIIILIDFDFDGNGFCVILHLFSDDGGGDSASRIIAKGPFVADCRGKSGAE